MAYLDSLQFGNAYVMLWEQVESTFNHFGPDSMTSTFTAVRSAAAHGDHFSAFLCLHTSITSLNSRDNSLLSEDPEGNMVRSLHFTHSSRIHQKCLEVSRAAHKTWFRPDAHDDAPRAPCRTRDCAEMWARRRREGIPLNCCTLLARNAAAVSVARIPCRCHSCCHCLLGSPHTRTFLPLLSPLSLLCKRGDVVGR